MAMNKQRRTSNINNIVTYDTLGDVTVPASITQGFAFSSLLKADGTGKIIAASGADYQQTISLTTIGNNGPSTFISNTLNIPNYTLAGLGGLSSARTLTINSVSYDLSADRTWSINLDSVTDVSAVTTNKITVGGVYITGMTAGSGALYYTGNRLTLANYNAGGTVYFEVNGGNYTMILNADLSVRLLGYTSNGFLKTSGSNGTLVVDTTSYVAATRNLTINGVTYDLSADRTWTISASGMAIGGNVTSATQGSVFFAGVGGVLQQDNANFFWDDTNNRLRTSSLLINTTNMPSGYSMSVNGGASFGDIATGAGFGGVVIYPMSTSQTRLGIFDGRLLMSNIIDISLFIDCGGFDGLGNQPVKIYTQEFYAGGGTNFPLCIQGNANETVFGSDTITTTPSSLVTMVSTTKGFLPPRMTAAQRAAISSPATGLIVYQTDGSFGLYVRNSFAWQLLGSGGGGGTGTVTAVSVATANGFAGTVVNDTTTPEITISTTVTGILKGNGTAISAAVANTDYQQPITLTTTGTSGAATKVGNTINVPNYTLTLTTTGSSGPATLLSGTLNIPNYSATTAYSDYYTPTISSATNCSNFTVRQLQYTVVNEVVHVSGVITFNPSNNTSPYSFLMSIPISFTTYNNYSCGGTCVRILDTLAATPTCGAITSGFGFDKVRFFFSTTNYSASTAITDWSFTFTYSIGVLH